MTVHRDRREAGLYEPKEKPSGLDEMTKDELLEHARKVGASPANASMSKDELRASIDEAAG